MKLNHNKNNFMLLVTQAIEIVIEKIVYGYENFNLNTYLN